MKKTYFTGLLAMVLIVLGCSTIDCPLNNRVYAKYKLAGEVKTLNKTLTITATTTAQSQYSDFPRIFPMAQMAMIGPRVTTCKPIVKSI